MRSKITLIAMVAAALAFPTAGALARGGGHGGGGGGGHFGGGGGVHASFAGGGHFGGGSRFSGARFSGTRFGSRGFVGTRFDRGARFATFRGSRSFARFGGPRFFHRDRFAFRHDRFFRHRFARFHHRRFFFGAPFFASSVVFNDYDYSCWRWRPTPFGWRRVWVCGYDYGYPFY